jgi:RNA polymerase sigma-70 factor (ECF subfamily)
VSRPDPVSTALEAILTRFAGVVRTVGARYRLPHSELDEVVQDVRVRLWRALGSGERIESISPSYLYRAATTAAIDVIRRRRGPREEPMETLTLMSSPSAVDHRRPDRDAECAELGAQIETALQRVGESRRPVVRMYLSGIGSTEIAQVMGWSEPKARNLLYRGLADLREHLEALGIGRDVA